MALRFLPLFIILFWGIKASAITFTPEGSTKHVTQVRAHFESDVSAVGNTKAPFQFACAFPGQGRWVTTRDWVYDFKDEVPAGHRCTFDLTLTSDLKGEKIAAAPRYSFDTGGPQVLEVDPNPEYSIMDEDQIFTLVVDSEIAEKTLSGHLYFEIPQIANPVAAKLVSLEELKKANPGFARGYESRKPLPLFIMASSRLPSGKTIQLVWDKGIESKNGVASQERQTFSFKTREAFRAIEACSRASQGADCSPFDDIFIRFTAPPSEKAEITVEGLAKDQKIERRNEQWILPGPHKPGTVYRITYKTPFQDDAGRDLVSPLEVKMKVGQFPPLIKFQAPFGILEWKGDPRLPVHLRKVEQDTKVRVLSIPLPTGKNQNVSAFIDWIKKNQEDDLAKALLPNGTPGMELRDLPAFQGKDNFEVRGLPLTNPGLYQLEVSSADLGKAYEKAAMHVHAQALVTDIVIHWKETKDNTLAWVTSLSSGLPVAEAAVSIYNCRLQKVGSGRTDAKGTLFLPMSQTKINSCAKNWPHWDSQGLLITAAKDQDFTFVFNYQTTGLESWRFGLGGDDNWFNPQIHTLLDRSLFRAGETLSALSIARKRVMEGLEIPKAKSLPGKVLFVHSGSGKSFTQNLSWDSQGRASLKWEIPKDAPLGAYDIRIGQQTTGTIAVREFKVATVKAQITPVTALPVAPKELGFHFSVNYLNGGASQNLNTKLRGHLDYAAPYQSAAYPGYVFQPIRDYANEGEDDFERDEPKLDQNQLKTVDAKLDSSGQGSATLQIPAIQDLKELRVELEFPDSNGELRTQPFSQILFPSASLLGLKAPEGNDFRPNTPYELQGVLMDLKEKPQQNKITLRRYKKTYISHRRRSIGGTYTYQSKVLVSDEVRICEVESDKTGLFHCTMSFAEAGNYLIRAESKDQAGRVVTSEIEVWVEGKQRWYAADDHDRIDLIADKKQYEPGDTAKILVKAPFPKAQILVAVEREGIKSYEVKDFDAKSPYVNIPIDRSFAPNIYVSVWLYRGRSKGTEPFLQVDLGKPAFKLGIVNLDVGRVQHTLAVTMKTDRKDYKPRDTVKVSIDVKSPLGALPADGAITLAAVDEGLLEVEPNLSWDLLSAMMGHRAYTGRDASSSMMVVGKRHFGLKALPAGGDGARMMARGSTRELFDTILKWSAIIPLKEGHADVEVPLNDSLSAFRIVAIAHAGADLFGRAETVVQSKKDLSLFSGLPALVRNGDEFKARFTVRNSTAQAMDIQLSGTLSESSSLPNQTVKIEGNGSKIVEWPIKVPNGVQELVYTIKAEGQTASDSLTITQKVVDPVPVQALLGELRSLDSTLDIPLDLPPEARTAALKLGVSATLGGESLAGVKAYMNTYPHTCMEQKLSRAVALQRKDLWDQSKLSSYLDGDGLLKFFPNGQEGSVELTAYALELAHTQGWALPEEAETRMIEALSRFTQGQLSIKGTGLFVQDKLRSLAALNLANHADEAQKTVKTLDLNPTYLSLTALVDLRRVQDNQTQVEALSPVDTALTQRMEFRGSLLQIKSDDRTLLGSGDATLARLILSRVKTDSSPEDLSTLVRSLLAAQKRGHWDTTVADALGTLALNEFAKKFDKTPATGAVLVTLGEIKKTLSRNAKTSESIVWPKGKTTLHLAKEENTEGHPWVTLLASAAIPLTKPISSGIYLSKTLKKVEGSGSAQKVGDIFEVEIKFKTNVHQDWSALTDPVPSGARIIPDTYSASYTEPGFEGMRAYFETLEPGEHTFQYRFQLNTAGTFILPPTRIEAMYVPEVFGMIPNENWTVE